MTVNSEQYYKQTELHTEHSYKHRYTALDVAMLILQSRLKPAVSEYVGGKRQTKLNGKTNIKASRSLPHFFTVPIIHAHLHLQHPATECFLRLRLVTWHKRIQILNFKTFHN